jgi:two-component system sensor histidine kinase KdpD
MKSQESHSNSAELQTRRVIKSLREAPYWRGYLLGLGLVCLATFLGHFVREFFAPTNMIMIYVLCVSVSALFGGLGPSILVSVLSVLAFDLFFVPPYLTFAVDDTQYIFTFIALLLVGMTISYLTSRVRQQTEAAKHREQEMAALYALGQDLAISNDLESYIRSITKRIKETLGHEVMIFLPDVQDGKKLKVYTGSNDASVGANEFTAAALSFQRQKTIGHGTDTPYTAGALYLPLVTNRGAVGVMALEKTDSASELTIEQERLLEAYADLAAVAIESIQLADELHNAQVLMATEKLQTALLNAISHDLRTPLVSVIGVLSSLQEDGMGLDDAAKKNLIQVAREEADRLNHLITNLLDESRIEAGAITLSRRPSEIHDLVGAALEQMGSRVGARSIKIDLPSDIPFISVDFGLIVQALANVLDNALKYSPHDSPIEIKVRQVAQEVYIEVADHGVGIPEQDLPHIFDKFFRIKRPDNVAGTGLGLSISKGIVEAHGGHIVAENREGAGTVIRLMLPVGEYSPKAAEKFNE